MGMQIPHCLGSQETAQNNIWQTAAGTEDDLEAVMPIQNGGGGGRDYEHRPHPYVFSDSAAYPGIIGSEQTIMVLFDAGHSIPLFCRFFLSAFINYEVLEFKPKINR